MSFNIGEKIKLLRKENSASQRELAEYLGIKAESVSKWERGVCAPDIAMLPDIALFFGVSIDELFSAGKRQGPESVIADLNVLYAEQKWHELAEKALHSVRDFPHECRICEMLLLAIIKAEMREECVSHKICSQAINIGKRIVNECTGKEKQKIIYYLCTVLYNNKRYEEGDFYYEMLNSASYSRESLDMYKYRGKELVKKLNENTAIWYNMLGMSFSKMAYNTNASEESLALLRKSYEYFLSAYESTLSREYLRMCVLLLLDISITYAMMKCATEAENAFDNARLFAVGKGEEVFFKSTVEKALKNSSFSQAGRELYKKKGFENE